MTLRSIVGLVLGLVLQVFLVVPSGACVSRERCEMQASTCSCCNGKTSCPCAKSSQNGEKRSGPVAPSADPLKVDPVIPAELIGMLPVSHFRAALPAVSQPSPIVVAGYAGVRLSVSFCRLVI